MTAEIDDPQNGESSNKGTVHQYLTFMLSEEEYGVDILRVQEIKGWEHVTALPNTPGYVKGVLNLRGAIVPIVDLRTRFALADVSYDDTTVVIVLRIEGKDEESDQRIVGVVVDAVSDVYTFEGEEMQPPPDFGSIISIDFVRGLATVDEKMVILLDIDQLIHVGVLDEMGSQLSIAA
jgi:purine-binding chemotaxis protein CheW